MQQKKLVGQHCEFFPGQHWSPGPQQWPLQQKLPLTQQSKPCEPVQHVLPGSQQNPDEQQVCAAVQQMPAVPHAKEPFGHGIVQAPWSHRDPAGHTLPQRPQFFESVERNTQPMPQQVWPCWHSLPPLQTPVVRSHVRPQHVRQRPTQQVSSFGHVDTHAPF